MSKNKKVIKSYEKLCRLSNIDIITSGRYLFNGFNYADYLAKDISKKLGLKKSDRLIDIGCNIGIYHKQLKNKVSYIFGVDAGQEIIKKAKKKNKGLDIDYMCFDVLGDDWHQIKKRFNKVLVYSVIHFFDNIEDVKRLLTGLLKILDDDFIILLGEVRDKKKYLNFKKSQKKKKFSLRNIQFFLNKMFHSFYLSKLPPQGSPTLFDSKEIFGVCHDLRIKAQLIDQSKKHPFYNTCVDYILKKSKPRTKTWCVSHFFNQLKDSYNRVAI